MDINTTKFIQHVEKIAKKHKVTLFFTNENFINCNSSVKCKGYFDNAGRELYVASKSKNSDWLRILAHEFSHMEQWIENTEVWQDCCVDDVDSETILDLWIDKKVELNKKQLKEYIEKSINVELDCERRTIQNIKKYKLPLNIKISIQKANAYLHFYHVLGKTREWYSTDDEPFFNKKIWGNMPDNFDLDYLKPNKKLLALYKK